MTLREDEPGPDEVRGWLDNLRHMKCAELKTWVEEKRPCTILDVRSTGEWVTYRIPGARHVPLQQLEDRLEEVLALPGPIVIHCEHGVRSMDAALFLLWQGRSDVINVEEGLSGWTGPVTRGPE